MSNLQDVPLANPEGPSLTDSSAVHQHKIGAVKRFLRIISFGLLFARKKESTKNSQQQSSSMDNSVRQDANGPEEIHEINQTTTLEVPPLNLVQGPQAQTAP